MPELTLLERIEALETGRDASGKTPVEVETRSVMTNLGKLLNTSQGNARIDLELGMSSLSEYSDDAISVMMEKVTKSIVRIAGQYEQRLSKVKVKTQADQSDVLGLYFTLEGVLSRQQNAPVFIKGKVKPGGRIVLTL